MVSDSREDCYFYLTQTCNKGSTCAFRHSEAAKNNLNVCNEWLSTKNCSAEDCQLKHSTYHLAQPVQTNKSKVQCYWDQSGGCTRPNCYFLHLNKKAEPDAAPKAFAKSDVPLKGVNPNATVFNPKTSFKPYEKKILTGAKSFADYAAKPATTDFTADKNIATEKSVSILSNQPVQNSVSLLNKNNTSVSKVNQPLRKTIQLSSGAQPMAKPGKNEINSRIANKINSFDPQFKQPPNSSTVPLSGRLGQINSPNITATKGKREKKVDKLEKSIKPQVPGTKNDDSDKKFSEIKVKSLQEILAEKRKKKAAETGVINPTSTITNGLNNDVQNNSSIYTVRNTATGYSKLPAIPTSVSPPPAAIVKDTQETVIPKASENNSGSAIHAVVAAETLNASGISEKRPVEEVVFEKLDEPAQKKTKEERIPMIVEEERENIDDELDFDIDELDFDGITGDIDEDFNLDELLES